MTHTTVVPLGAQARPQGGGAPLRDRPQGGRLHAPRGGARPSDTRSAPMRASLADPPASRASTPRSKTRLSIARSSLRDARGSGGVYVADVDACGGRPGSRWSERPGNAVPPAAPPGAAAAAVAVTRAARAGVATRPSASFPTGPSVRRPPPATLSSPRLRRRASWSPPLSPSLPEFPPSRTCRPPAVVERSDPPLSSSMLENDDESTGRDRPA